MVAADDTPSKLRRHGGGLEAMAKWVGALLVIASFGYNVATAFLRADFVTKSELAAALAAVRSEAGVRDASVTRRLDELAASAKANTERLDQIYTLLVRSGR